MFLILFLVRNENYNLSVVITNDFYQKVEVETTIFAE